MRKDIFLELKGRLTRWRFALIDALLIICKSSQNYFTQMKEKMTDFVRVFLHRVENILYLPTLYQSFDILQ